MSSPTQQLTQILLFHVLPGAVLSADVTDGMQATTQQGKPVSFEVAADAVRLMAPTSSCLTWRRLMASYTPSTP